MTIREIISLVRNEMNSITLDDRISNRFIFNKIIVYTEIILKRESDSRRLFNSTDIFTTLDCFDLKETSIASCTNIYLPKCKTFMRSILPIPAFYSSIYGNLLIVQAIDGSNRFEQTTPENYKNISSREFKPKTGYYWINNNHLILPDSEVETVSLRYIPKISVNSCTGLDQQTGIPAWLITDIIKYVIQDLRNMKSIVKDENPDLNSNTKT